MPALIPRIGLYQDWLAATHGLHFSAYADLHRWSVTDLELFWRSIWNFNDLRSPTPFAKALTHEIMPGAVWFGGATLNYADQVMRHAAPAHAAGQPAIVAEDERGIVAMLDWPELQRQIAAFATGLLALGVTPGDRVVAYLPNGVEAAVAFLACASIGAVWSVCAPDMGVPAIEARFQQIAPKILIAADGVFYAGRALDRGAVIAKLRAALPSLRAVVIVHTPHGTTPVPNAIDFRSLADARAPADFAPLALPFDHPLWVLYSSGTTGLPKALVHSHGGVVLTTLAGALHLDLGASYDPNNLGERFHWYTTTGWVMWNVQIGGLLTGTTICLFDGSPSGTRAAPDWTLLWRFAARHRVTFLGAGAAFHGACARERVNLAACGDLASVRVLGSTGSPLPADTQAWGTAAFARIGTPDIWWCNISGGTDVCGSFATGNRELPPTPGAMQCRQLGAAVESWNESGRPVIGEVGELVCVRPLPSMPIYLWGDVDGSRYRAAYFDHHPGVWRHGDWLRIDADERCTISGRSDATINRGGLRMGTSEIYAAVECLPEVLDALVLDIEGGLESADLTLILFVATAPGIALDDALRDRISTSIRSALSPRFVPDVIAAAPAIPRTLSGKKQELPIKRILQGVDPARAIDRSAMANPETIDWFARFSCGVTDGGAR